MANDECTHQAWWAQLRTAHELGLLPVVTGAADELAASLERVADDLRSGAFAAVDCTDTDAMLEAAGKLEFFMLDPIFSELIEQTDPKGTDSNIAAYGRHVERLAGAIERHYRRDELAALLAAALRRSWVEFLRTVSGARFDQLTRTLNRRSLLESLDQWAAWSGRYRRPLAVVAVDIDHFKRINDTHGHASGDLALLAFANALRAAVRDSDLIGRQGGDEFAIIAPETDGHALQRLMERIVGDMPTLTRTDWPYQTSLPIQASAGGAWTPGGSGVTGEALLAAADAALYEAKEAGRNRTAPARRIGVTSD